MANSLVLPSLSSLLQVQSLCRRPPLPHFNGAHRQITRRNRCLIVGKMDMPGLSAEDQSKEVPKVTNVSDGPVSTGGSPRLPLPNIPTWAKWVLGSIICLALPFYRRVSRVEDGVEKVAETTAAVVEKVAETARKVAADIADALPEHSKLKQEVLDIGHFAEEVEKGAEQAEEIILKVDHMTDEMNEAVEQIIGEGEKTEKEKVETFSSSQT